MKKGCLKKPKSIQSSECLADNNRVLSEDQITRKEKLISKFFFVGVGGEGGFNYLPHQSLSLSFSFSSHLLFSHHPSLSHFFNFLLPLTLCKSCLEVVVVLGFD